MCVKEVKNITHNINACRMLEEKEYRRRHYMVTIPLHWCLCRKYRQEVFEKWNRHKAEKVIENNQEKILCNFDIQTVLEATEPDIIIIDEETGNYLLIDVAVPIDHDIKVREIDMLRKYTDIWSYQNVEYSGHCSSYQ